MRISHDIFVPSSFRAGHARAQNTMLYAVLNVFFVVFFVRIVWCFRAASVSSVQLDGYIFAYVLLYLSSILSSSYEARFFLSSASTSIIQRLNSRRDFHIFIYFQNILSVFANILHGVVVVLIFHWMFIVYVIFAQRTFGPYEIRTIHVCVFKS